MKNKGAKQRSKKKGSDNAFGCNLIEHLQSSGQDVPQVLKTCAEFIEKHGVVDGIYRLSGVTSNIQRLRQEFCTESCPDLTKEVYLQDIHCVGSLCKLYFRELPNPLLTHELYKQFTDAALVQGDHEKLQHIQGVIKELPVPHFRTLEYLTKHLAHLATLSPQTNMHTRNLALVWAPNLLRSKEVLSRNGDIAFQEVRVQQSVVEFILNHTEQIFNNGAVQTKPKEGPSVVCGEKYATLPISGQGGPMKLMSLEEAQARSLSPNHPARRERQRENSLPDTSTATLYHTVLDMSDSKRKLSGKSKKWKSIFNLGKSVTDSKGKLNRNGSVLMREQNVSEKTTIRPARSMDSLCSLPTEDEKSSMSMAGGGNGFAMKSRTLGSDTLYDLNEQDQKWECDRTESGKATGGGSPSMKRRGSPGTSAPPPKALPEQLKVFKGDDLSSCQPTSPKNRRMLYSGSSHSSSSRPSFPGSLFPLESSPRHQRKALNISEPFAVSVPLRVSAVISSNSTPCRAPGKDRPPAGAALKPSREYSQSELSDGNGGSACRESTLGESRVGNQPSMYRSNSFGSPLEMEDRPAGKKSKEDPMSTSVSEDSVCEGEKTTLTEQPSTLEGFQSSTNQTIISTIGDKQIQQSPGKQLDNRLAPYLETKIQTQLDSRSSLGRKEQWSDLHLELKITEPEFDLLEEEPVLCSTKTICQDVKPKLGLQSKRRSSLPNHSLLYKGQPFMCAKPQRMDHFAAMTGEHSGNKYPSDTLTSFDKDFDFIVSEDTKDPLPHSPHIIYKPENKLSHMSQRMDTDSSFKMTSWLQLPPHTETNVLLALQNPVTIPPPSGNILDISIPVAKKSQGASGKHTTDDEIKKAVRKVKKLVTPAELVGGVERLSLCPERPHTLQLAAQEEEDGRGGRVEELELVEPWEDFSSNKHWVTSPLHSPTLKELFEKLEVSPPFPVGERTQPKEGDSAPLSSSDKDVNRSGPAWGADLLAGHISQTNGGKTETNCLRQQPTSSKTADDTRPHKGPGCAGRTKNTTLTSQRFHRQTSHSEASRIERTEENGFSKHRPYSLNLDLGHRCIRDISNQQNRNSFEFSSTQLGAGSASGPKPTGMSLELELFLNNRQAPLRRNSAPVSVSSVRTAFMIKTCQAKAVPVIPPKVQYSHIPHSRHDKSSNGAKGQGKEVTKTLVENVETVPLFQPIRKVKEELENEEPAPKSQRQPMITDKATEACKTATTSDVTVLRRKRPTHFEPFVDLPKPDRPNLLQRSSFRSRQRPQSLILFSPPFPIMDYPTLGDEGKVVLSPIKSPTETLTLEVFSKELTDNIRTPEGVTLRSKMTMPKSGQRLETSTSCFYQPQRRSMIFDNRSHRQIE
ncbi:rho GTPase-activating protein 31 isoform X2 [Osmerus eperlanus]|uniref:rho GTPase-activating protein 31 isoform X2 n=1 Tax=Osmerus eperlanus TaxID=29151 RepID=UPI002E0D817D